MPTGGFRKLLLPMAFVQLLAGYIPNALNFGTPIGDRVTQNGIPPELPPGPFFAIWGIIFTAYFAFGIYAWRKDDELVRRLAAPLVFAGGINTIWMLSAQFLGSTVLETLILLPLIYFAWKAAWQFDTMRGMGGSLIKWTGDLLSGLLSGWAVVALSISVPRLWRELLGQGPTDYEWYSLWSVILTAQIATSIFRRRVSRTLWYYAALGWGIAGILTNNWTRTGYGFLGWIALLFGLWIIFRRLSAGATGAARRRTL